MRKALSWSLGFLLGAAAGATLMLLFAPTSGDKLLQNLRRGYDEARQDAYLAAEERRLELEAQLAAVRKGEPLAETRR